MHGRAIQCKHTPYGAVLSKSDKGSHVHMCACMTGIPRFVCSAWVENIANAWLPCTNIWENLIKGVNQTSPWSSLVLIHSACPYKNYAPKCSQFPHKLVCFFYLVCNLVRNLDFFFQASQHTKQKKNCPDNLK